MIKSASLAIILLALCLMGAKVESKYPIWTEPEEELIWIQYANEDKLLCYYDEKNNVIVIPQDLIESVESEDKVLRIILK